MPRIMGAGIILFWAACMSWLVIHDVLPGWSASRPPASADRAWLADEEHRKLAAKIIDDAGECGRIRTVYEVGETTIRRTDVIELDRLSGLSLGVRIDVDSTFLLDGTLDEIDLRVGLGEARSVARVRGERFPTAYAFSLELGSGPLQTFKLPLSGAGMITESINPFTSLPKLQVGQSWRISVLNPMAMLAGALPLPSKLSDRYVQVVVRVTGKERIATYRGPRDCFVVEMDEARAWVDEDGVVMRQEVRLPFGSLTIERTRFEEEPKREVRSSRRSSETTRGR